MRIVSLVPSATESLLAWGITPVACTRFCEQPDIPHIGGTKDPDLDAIVELAPDLVVMCEEENLRPHHDELVERGLRTFTFHIDALDDVGAELTRLAGEVKIDAPPLNLPGGATSDRRLRAFVPIWRRPWMTMSGGTYGSSLLQRLGVQNVFADAKVRYPEVDLNEVAARSPDVILLPTEPYPFKERHRSELSDIATTMLVDGQDLFWWGTRTPAAMERLTTALAEL